MFLSSRFAVSTILSVSLVALISCSSDEDPSANGHAGTGASGGSAGTTGGTSSAGKGGTSTTGGSAGTGMAGGGGTAGSGGSSGSGGAGGTSAGAAGSSSGAAGNGGTAGTAAGSAGAGAGGMAGNGTSGNGGAAGNAGASGSSGTAGSGGSGGGGMFALTSPAFENRAGCSEDMADACDVFPNENISYMMNMNVSPELSWTNPPAGTMSYAVVLQDLSNGFAHWVLWNIPGTTTMIPANVDKDTAMPSMPAGSQQASAAMGGEGYFGPGSACNVYEFVLYALAVPTFSPMSPTNQTSVRMELQALGDDILGEASLRGRSNYMMMCD